MHSDLYTLTILGRLWTGTGLRGGIGLHPAFILCGSRRSSSPTPACCPHGGGSIEAGIVHIIRFFWGVGGRACAL